MARLTALLLIALGLPGTGAAAPASDDPVLDTLIDAALAQRPELAGARAQVEAERGRSSRTGALPGLTLGLGIQNDGFTSIEVGRMETSWLTVMLTQPFYWPGKRALREQVAGQDVTAAEARVLRVRLAVEADVRRAYLSLLLVRGKLELLDRLEALWSQVVAVTEARYSVGEGSQADVLRSRLERSRLELRRLSLAAAERSALHALNRLRNQPFDHALSTMRPLPDVPLPEFVLPDALADAVARTPELLALKAARDQAASGLELARLEAWPDLAVSAGVMPRGALMPMWSLGVNVALPGFDGRRAVAVEEATARADLAEQGSQALRDVVRLRTSERLTVLAAARATIALYRSTFLAQVEGVVASTLEQYGVGRVPMAAVLESLQTYVTERAAYLDAIAQAQRLAIAQGELSLATVELLAGGLGGGAVPGTAATESAGAATAGTPAAPAGATASGAAMGGM